MSDEKYKEDFPPNYQEILKAILDVEKSTTVTFCYGDTIYNPYKLKLTEDLIYHESVHSKQQGDTPDEWWSKYLTDVEFRLSQELEAYGEQYQFVKARTMGKLTEWVLDRLAEHLAGPLYGNLLNLAQAKSKIRNYGK